MSLNQLIYGMMLCPVLICADTISLFDLPKLISEENRELQVLALDTAISGEQVKEVRSLFLPQIDGLVSYQAMPSKPSMMFPGEIVGAPGTSFPVSMGSTHENSLSLQMSQLIISASAVSSLKMAKLSQEVPHLLKYLREEDILLKGAKTYMTILALQQNREIIKEHYSLLEDIKKVTDLRIMQGSSVKTDLQRIEADLISLESEIKTIDDAITVHQSTLAIILGRSAKEKIEVAHVQLTDTLFDVRTDSLPHPALELKSLEGDIKEMERKSVALEYTPSIAAYVSLDKDLKSESFPAGDSDEWSSSAVIGVQMSVPIFSGGNRKSRLNQVEYEEQQIQLEEKELSEQIRLNIDQSRLTCENSSRDISVQKQRVTLLEAVGKNEKLRYGAGHTSLYDLLRAESELRQARSQLNAAHYTHLINLMALENAKGQLRSTLETIQG